MAEHNHDILSRYTFIIKLADKTSYRDSYTVRCKIVNINIIPFTNYD